MMFRVTADYDFTNDSTMFYDDGEKAVLPAHLAKFGEAFTF